MARLPKFKITFTERLVREFYGKDSGGAIDACFENYPNTVDILNVEQLPENGDGSPYLGNEDEGILS